MLFLPFEETTLFITVAICTWNRANLLDQTLAQFRKLSIPKNTKWELLVVNNNCVDNTDVVISSYTDQLPIRWLFEPKQGHSNARNCAIVNARGDLLIWTDDDVIVPENWLAEYAQAAAAFPEATFFGGPVRPWWESTPPEWIDRDVDRIGWLWALLDRGPDVRRLASSEWVHGANMAYRTEVLRHRLFDPALGHIGNYFQGGDEISLVEELQRLGQWGVWIGSAPVQHFITKDRMRPRYVWNLVKANVRQSARAKEDYSHYPTLCGYPRWMIRQYFALRVKSFLLSAFRTEAWLRAYMAAAELRGILGALHERRNQALPAGESIPVKV